MLRRMRSRGELVKPDRTPPAALPRVMPFKLACRESGFSYTGMRDEFFRGNLAIVKVGKRWYIETAELSRFVESHREHA